ncbi:MAG: type II secretion system F family protein [Candidatus Diapherotrites archaeon]|nr:type II secretion system F family protein [Candidatus Diapherotrites archaeon]
MGLLDRLQKKQGSPESLDFDKVDEIVKRMQKKYAEQGFQEGESGVSEKFSNIQSAVQGQQITTVQVQKVEELKTSENKMVSFFGKLFFTLKGITQPISKAIMSKSLVQKLNINLNAANMKYSVTQWIALSVAGAITGLLLGIFIGIILTVTSKFSITLIPLIGLFLFIIILFVMLLIPKRRAMGRANSIDRELPFALRHMATELRAGIGFYRTLQTIASADYGVLSQEFSRTIIEIEEGTETKTALKNLSERTYSKSLKTALGNMVRSLKTGGNLSDAMDEIAEEVSFDLRTQLQTFSSKMNFFGVIFIFVAIVLPVFVSILGAIRNMPLQSAGLVSFDAIPFTPPVIGIIYLIVMPIILIGLLGYILSIQPKT